MQWLFLVSRISKLSYDQLVGQKIYVVGNNQH